MAEAVTVDDIRGMFVEKLSHSEEIAGTVEILGASFIATEPIIFGKQDDDYVKRELQWYMSGSLKVADIPGETPKIWKNVASMNGEINSNYGHLLFSPENCLQYQYVLDALKQSSTTRRAVAIYTRPSMQWDWRREGMRDFICTNAVHYNIRDNRLHTIVQMRSNDAVFGYKNDLAWQTFVRDKLINDLSDTHPELAPGDIIWQAASLHVYARHYHLIEHYAHTFETYISKSDFEREKESGLYEGRLLW